jgi:hypothetical protein
VIYLSASNGEQCIQVFFSSGREQCYNDSLFPVGAPSGVVQLQSMSSKEAYATLITFVSQVYRERLCSKSIAVVGELDSQTANIIHTLADRSNISIMLVASSTPPNLLPVSNLELPSVFDMNPIQHYIDAVVSFVDRLNWTRIGLITDDTLYHLFAVELLQKRLQSNPQRTITPYIRFRKTQKINFQEFKECGTQIMILLVVEKLQCLILSEATTMGFMWPKYALIFFNVESSRCQFSNGVFLLTSSSNHKTDLDQCSFYFSCLIQSISAISSAQGLEFSVKSFDSTSKFRKGKNLINISIIQIQDGRDVVIGMYNSEHRELNFSRNDFSGDEVPLGKFTVVNGRGSKLETVMSLTFFLLSLVFITVNLILYFVFRKEAEVRATSFSVSMCMFLGCYLLVLFLPALLYQGEPQYSKALETFICNLLVWLSSLGLPFSLIFATLIVKMLRVYLIFCNPHSYRKQLFSDSALLLYILIISSPGILILILSLAIDRYTEVSVDAHMKSYTFAYRRCSNEHIIIWIMTLLVYNLCLITTVVFLALKSSRIRYKNFRDTKATNAFAYLSIFIACMSVVYWYVFRSLPVSLEVVRKSVGCLYAGHITEAWICQVFLFVPKVYPPLIKWFSRNRVKSKKQRG